MVIKNCEDKYTYLFWVTKGLKTINAKTTTFSGSRFLVVFLILNSLYNRIIYYETSMK